MLENPNNFDGLRGGGMKSKGFSFVAYAKHRKDLGVSGTTCEAVSKAVQAGRIEVNEFNKISDMDLADKQWEENTSHSHRRAQSAKGENEKNSDSVEIKGNSVENQESENGGENQTGSSNQEAPVEKLPAVNSLNDQKSKEAYWNAQLKELDFKKKSGELVNARQVEREAFNAARMVRDKLLQLPQKNCHELVAIKAPDEMEIKLNELIVNALQELVIEPSVSE